MRLTMYSTISGTEKCFYMTKQSFVCSIWILNMPDARGTPHRLTTSTSTTTINARKRHTPSDNTKRHCCLNVEENPTPTRHQPKQAPPDRNGHNRHRRASSELNGKNQPKRASPDRNGQNGHHQIEMPKIGENGHHQIDMATIGQNGHHQIEMAKTDHAPRNMQPARSQSQSQSNIH